MRKWSQCCTICWLGLGLLVLWARGWFITFNELRQTAGNPGVECFHARLGDRLAKEVLFVAMRRSGKTIMEILELLNEGWREIRRGTG